MLVGSEALANNWNGLSIRTISGFHLKWLGLDSENSQGQQAVGVLSGWGLEYGLPLKGNLLALIEASFPYHDGIFEGGSIHSAPIFGGFLFPKFLLAFVPVWIPSLGYQINDKLLISFGTVYLWGLHLSIRRLVSDFLSMELHFSWFFDRFLLKDGLHDAHITFSIRYLFN